MVGEIGGFRLSLRRAQEQNETLTILVNKLEGEVAYLKRQISGINDQKEKLKESYSMYGKSLEQTEQELAQVMQVCYFIKRRIRRGEMRLNQVYAFRNAKPLTSKYPPSKN